MLYPGRRLNICSRFLFAEGSNLPYSIVLREWLLTRRSALPCICMILRLDVQNFTSISAGWGVGVRPKKYEKNTIFWQRVASHGRTL